jgi:predicted permease
MRFALRQLAKNPGFTVVALLTLALGIGVNTTSFSVLNRLLLQALPYREPGRLVRIYASTPQNPLMEQSPGDYFDLCRQNTVFDGVAAYVPGSMSSFAEPGQAPVRCLGVPVTANFFPTLGVEAQKGRTFTTDEQKRQDSVVVVSNSFWRQHFGSDPGILGRTVRLNSKMFTIVGVMPATLDDPLLFNGWPAFWTLDPTETNTNLRNLSWYSVAARLRPGVTIEMAQAQMTVLAQRLAHDYPKTNLGRGQKVVAFPAAMMDPVGVQLTWLVMALSAMVLLIACVNLANLQLVRTTRRAQEIGVRLALGCTRRQLIGMLLTENLVLSVGGGLLGLLVAVWSNGYVAHYLDVDMPLNLRVIGFTFLASMATGAAFGTVPAWIASGADVSASLAASARGASSGRSRHRLRQVLVTVELGLALTLLAGAGFFVSGIYKLTHRDLGWSTDNEIVGFIELDHDHYGEFDDPRSLAFSDRMIAALRALPGVQQAATGMDTVAEGLRPTPVRVEGQPAPERGKETLAGSTTAGPGYLEVYRIPLVRGRDFNETDRHGSRRVAIINESMSRTLWPGENPIGKRFGGTDPADPRWTEVVGVMGDFTGAAEFYNRPPNPMKYLVPWAQNNHRFIPFHVRSAGSPEPLVDSVRRSIGLLAPDFALSYISTVRQLLDAELSYFSFIQRVLVQIAALGLLLSAVGIYGVVANLASERTREIGIRMALGAQPRGLVWLFLRNGVKLALIGAAAGLVASFVLLRILNRMLPSLPGNNPWIVAGVAAGLVGVAVLACWIPANRTTRVSPIEALRAE